MARWKRNRQRQKKKQGSKDGDTGNPDEKRPNKKPDEPGRGRRDQLYNMIERGCLRLETYYALQGLHDWYWDDESEELKPCLTDEQKDRERQNWLKHMKSILPSSFRIGNDVDVELRKRLEEELDQFVGTEMEIFVETNEGGQQKRRTPTPADTDDNDISHDQSLNQEEKEKEEQPQVLKPENEVSPFPDAETNANLVSKTVAPAKKIPFVPHAYQLSLDRNTIRRNPCLEKFHNWLKVQTAAGFITRQETVSMIPPVVLHPESHHVVLDMCAAPGSKTSQLLEVVSLPTASDDSEPRGCVVANDADSKRAHMLVHQLRRINSPAVLVTSCDAQFFPVLRQRNGNQMDSDSLDLQEGMFDRVLCDVPCTGDGTARKNPHLWRQWTQAASLALHPLQLNIALQGARLTKVGGYLCYSTCSMNPIENEAVVAELLRQSKGGLQLVDRRPFMPGLRARPGWSYWRVLREIQYRKEHRNRHNNKAEDNEQKTSEPSQAVKDNEENDGDDAAPIEDVDGDGDDDEKVDGTNDEVKIASGEGFQASGIKPTEGDGRNSNGKGWDRFRAFVPPVTWDDAAYSTMAEAAGFVEFKSFDELPEVSQRKIRVSCFPPSAAEAATFGLEKCLRCLPQDMDTGGFFVALFQKVAPMRPPRKVKAARKTGTETASEEPKAKTETAPEEPIEDLEPEMKRAKISDDESNNEKLTGAIADETGVVQSTQQSDVATGQEDDAVGKQFVEGHKLKKENDGWEAKNKKGNLLPGKDGVPIGDVGRDDFIAIADDVLVPLINYYGLSPAFPKDQLMARAGGEAHKSLYFISRTIKTLIDSGIQKRLTVINSGLKSFVKNNNHCDCAYRVAQEGIQFLVPYMTKRKIVAELNDFTLCLNGPGTLPIENFSKPFAEAVRPLDVGSFVVVLRGYEGDFSRKMILVMWRGRGDTLKSLVSRIETGGFKSKLRAIAGEPFNWEEIQQDTAESNGDEA